MGVGGQCHTHLLYPREIDVIPTGTEDWVGRSGQVWKISPPLDPNPWTNQPAAGHYTNYTILAHILLLYISQVLKLTVTYKFNCV